MNYRNFGHSGVALSALCLGSMRLDPRRVGVREGVRLFEEARALGVTTWHSSSEYDTHGHFCEVLRAFRAEQPGARVVHVSKIAAPHFEDAGFDAGVLRARVEQQLRELGAERLDVVQWLARSKPVSDALRLPALAAMRRELADVVHALRREGKVGAWAAFPYSKAWADAFSAHGVCDGMVTYLNLAELEFAGELDAMGARGHGFVAIRPLLAGMLAGAAVDDAQRAKRDAIAGALAKLDVAQGDLARFALRFPLLHPNVASVMLSVSSVEHLREAAEATGDVEPDAERFQTVVEALAS